MVYISRLSTPLGEMTAASDGENIVGLWFNGQKYFMAGVSAATERGELQCFKRLENWLERYFGGENPPPNEIKITPDGSFFRKTVWKILTEIPYGKTASYGEIAKKAAESFGKERISARAVGGAVGHNPISIIIPCHRVLGAHGEIVGYAGGIDKKLKLLALEGAIK